MSKKPRLDQIPAANLDADDPLTDVCISFMFSFIFLPLGFAVNRIFTFRLAIVLRQVLTYLPLTVIALWWKCRVVQRIPVNAVVVFLESTEKLGSWKYHLKYGERVTF